MEAWEAARSRGRATHEQGRYEEAAKHREEAVGLAAAIDPEWEHPDWHFKGGYRTEAVVLSLEDLARSYTALEYYRWGEVLLLRSLAIRTEADMVDLRDHYRTPALRGLARLYYAQGRLDEGDARYEEALAMWEPAMEPGPFSERVYEYSRLLQQTGRSERSAEMRGRAARIRSGAPKATWRE